MNPLISHNIHEFQDSLIVCGACLPNMDEQAFAKLKQISNNVFFVCLEETHMNMVAHKIASILRLGKVKSLIFATVDKSPHCVQLHYIRNELEKIMNLEDISITDYISKDGNLIEILPETISLSKELTEVQRLISNNSNKED